MPVYISWGCSVSEDSISVCRGGGGCSCFLSGHFALGLSSAAMDSKHLLPSSCLFRLPSARLSVWQKHTHAIWSTGFLIVPRDKCFYTVCFPVFQWVCDSPAPPSSFWEKLNDWMNISANSRGLTFSGSLSAWGSCIFRTSGLTGTHISWQFFPFCSHQLKPGCFLLSYPRITHARHVCIIDFTEQVGIMEFFLLEQKSNKLKSYKYNSCSWQSLSGISLWPPFSSDMSLC